MTATQDADLILNALLLGLLLWLSAVSVARWIRRGCVESYSSEELMPKWLPAWPRWAMGVLLLTPIYSVTDRPSRNGLTAWGWLFLAVVAVWLVTRMA